MSDIERAIHGAFEGVSNVVLAISGGVDSMVMLHAFAQTLPCPAVVCHVDHQLRDGSADDAAFTESACKALGLPYYLRTVDVDKSASLQNRARSQRLAALRGVALRLGYDTVATAHHHDDWVEHFYLATTRGAGFESIEQRTAHHQGRETWIKPLTYVTKKAILAYAAQHRLSWRDDPSNATPQYARNRVRAALDAAVDSHGDGTLATRRRFESSARIVRHAATSLYREAELTSSVPNLTVLRTEPLRDAPEELAGEVFRLAAQTLQIDLTSSGVKSCLEVLGQTAAAATVKDLYIVDEKDRIVIARNFARGATWFDQLRRQPAATLRDGLDWFGGSFVTLSNHRDPSLYNLATNDRLEVRGWIPGLGLPKSVNKRVKSTTKWMRWAVPVVFARAEPCWVPGIWKSDEPEQANHTFGWVPTSIDGR